MNQPKILQTHANWGSKEEWTFDLVMEVVKLVFWGLTLLNDREKP